MRRGKKGRKKEVFVYVCGQNEKRIERNGRREGRKEEPSPPPPPPLRFIFKGLQHQQRSNRERRGERRGEGKRYVVWGSIKREGTREEMKKADRETDRQTGSQSDLSLSSFFSSSTSPLKINWAAAGE